MSFVPSNRRVFAGLFLAMPFIAIGPLVAVAQYGNARTAPNGYPAQQSAKSFPESHPFPQRESLFGDQRINWKMPFTREKTPAKTQFVPQQSMAPRSIPKSALQDPRYAAGAPTRANMPGRVPTAQHQAMPNRYQPRNMAKPMAQTARAPQRTAQRSNVPQPPQPPRASHSQSQHSPRGMPNAAATAPVSMAPPKQAVLESRPASPTSPAMQMLAQAHEWSTSAETETDFTRVIDTCRQVQAGKPTPEINRFASELASWALNRRGQLKADAGREDVAMADFEAAIQADSKRWRPIHNRGVLRAGEGEFERAFEDFTRTIELNSRFAKAYSNRAALFVVAGNVQAAIEDYGQAVELDPELNVAHRGLGRARHLEGNLDEAVRHYDESIRLAPNDAYAIASRADVFTDLGRYAEAAAEYDRAIEADPNSSHAHSGSAWLLAACPDDAIRNPKLGVERAQTAIELTTGEDAASLDVLAAAQASNGDFAGAIQSVTKAVQMATDSEKQSYKQRLALYQQEKPYHLDPANEVIQISHESK